MVPPGKHLIGLGFYGAGGRRVHLHRETLFVAPPLPEDSFPGSDAFVPSASDASETAINALPSVVRGTDRTLLPDPVRTILVQRADQLGDLVCSVPAVRRLRQLFPDARLVGLVSTANAALAGATGLFDVIETIQFEESPAERRRVMPVEAQADLRRRLHDHAFDLAIDLGEGDESRALLLLSGAKFLYGFKDRNAPWLDAGLDFNAHDPINGIELIPPSRKMLLLIEGLGAMARGAAAPMPNPDRAPLVQFGIGSGDRYVVIHAGARLAYSRWPHFDALIEMLLEGTELKIVLFSDDSTKARAAAERHGRANRLHVVAGLIDFAAFDALLAHCSLFVGNDSGPKHLAALRNAPVISLHMARLNWSEWGQEMTGRIISRRVPCAGCAIGLDGEDCGKGFACLVHIRPEEVFETALSLLEAIH
jgi:ADP-heptose:LPS heptosyltransferase